MGNKLQDGFTHGITVRGIPLSQAYPGKVFWVNSSSVITKNGVGGSDSAPGTYNRPFATVDYAISKVTAGRGDVIAVMPGYTGDIAAASGIALDVAGVALVGLGTGTLRPQITFSETDSTFVVSAANSAVIGFDFISNKSDVVTLISITAAGLGTSFENCTFTETTPGNDLNYKAAVTLTTLVDDISFIGCRFAATDVLMDSFITGVAHDRLYIENCSFFQHAAQTTLTALIVGSTLTSGVIRDSSFRSNKDGAKFLGFSGASTGVTWGCSFTSIDTAGGTGSAGSGYVTSGFHCHNCYVSGDADGWAIQGGGTAIAADA